MEEPVIPVTMQLLLLVSYLKMIPFPLKNN